MRFVWDDVWKTDGFGSARLRQRRAERRMHAMMKILPPGVRLGRVLEIGCGDGSFAEAISRSEWIVDEYDGFDLSPTAINRAKAKALPTNYRFSKTNVQTLQLERNSFDTVFALGLLEHIESPKPLVAAIRAACHSDAKVIITTSNAFSTMHLARRVRQAIGRWPYGYQYNYTEKELRLLLAPEFRVIHGLILHGDWDFPIASMLDRLGELISPNVGRYLLVVAEPV